MSGFALLGGAFAIFLVAAAAIAASTLLAARLFGMALNPNRPKAQRRLRGALAALAVLGVFASATTGYVGITALMYYSQKAATPGEP